MQDLRLAIRALCASPVVTPRPVSATAGRTSSGERREKFWAVYFGSGSVGAVLQIT